MGATRRCTSGKVEGGKACGKPLTVRMVPSEVKSFAGVPTVVFRKSIPVLTCPSCDTAPQRKKDTMHPPS